MSKKNYIKLNRSILTHWIWPTGRAYTETEAWVWLLLKAAHSIHKGHSDKKVLTVHIGEILTSIKHLSDEFGWGWRRTKCFLENLKNDDMIDIADGTRYSIRVIIKNYAAFQGKNDDVCRADDIADSIPDDIACDELTTELTSLESSQRVGKDTPIIKGNKGRRKEYISSTPSKPGVGESSSSKKSPAQKPGYTPSSDARALVNYLSDCLKRYGAKEGQFSKQWFFAGCRVSDELLKLESLKDLKEAIEYLVEDQYIGQSITTMQAVKKNLLRWQRYIRAGNQESLAKPKISTPKHADDPLSEEKYQANLKLFEGAL